MHLEICFKTSLHSSKLTSANVGSYVFHIVIVYPITLPVCSYMWQSCVEIEGYFIALFIRIAVYEAPYR